LGFGCISVAAVTADYGFALTATHFSRRRKVSKRLRPGVRRLAKAPRTLATVSIRGHRLRSASRRPPLDVCGCAARRYAPNPLMDTYARPAEGAKDQKQIKIKIKIKIQNHGHIAGRLLQPCTGLTNQLPQLGWAPQKDICRLPGRLRRQASSHREIGTSGNYWSATRPPSLASQLPQGNRYIWELLVGWPAAIAGKPAPTGKSVHLRKIGRLSGRHREQAHSHRRVGFIWE
jgi:hypothetical protein